MNVLIPILSQTENSSEFIQFIPSTDKVVLLLPIDKSSKIRRCGFTASEISDGQKLITVLKQKLTEKNIVCEDMVDWCNDVAVQIDRMAQLKQCTKIILAKQNNAYFNDIVAKLSQSQQYSVQLV